MAGKIIVLEGLDGSGKATQAELLCGYLQKKGVTVRKRSFPNYESDSSALVRMYLQGEMGSHPDDVNAYAASSFYAVDRYADYMKYWREYYLEGGIIVADRYTTSNAVHQCSKLPPEQWDSFLDWLFHYEYHLLGIPAPALTLYLRVDPEVSQRLVDQRCVEEHVQKDIHEQDRGYLQRSQQAASYCAQKLGWQTVECCHDGSMRSIEDIQKEVAALAEDAIRQP